MLLAVSAIVFGLVALVWSADRFVLGASATAGNLGISPLMIGLVVVGFGTSAPELLVSVLSAVDGNPGLALGNAVGSNIANIGLVVGVTSMIVPLTVGSTILRREFPVMMAIMLGVLVLLADGELGRVDGLILSAATVVLVGWIIWTGTHTRRGDPLEAEFKAELPRPMSTGRALFWLVLGLLLLLLSSRVVVWGAVTTATSLGVSDFIIGLTIVAIGTSLPELAASVMGALKGEPDIAIGNVLGSNMFNMVPVLALPGLIAPHTIDPGAMHRDYPVMLLMSVLFLLMAWDLRGERKVSRWEGAVLSLGYVAYLVWLGYSGL